MFFLLSGTELSPGAAGAVDTGLWWPHAGTSSSNTSRGSWILQSHPELSLLNCGHLMRSIRTIPCPGSNPSCPNPSWGMCSCQGDCRGDLGGPLPCSPFCAFGELTWACSCSFSSVTLGWGSLWVQGPLIPQKLPRRGRSLPELILVPPGVFPEEGKAFLPKKRRFGPG